MLYITLQEQMEQCFPKAFMDSDVASVALQLYKATQNSSSLELEVGWQRNLFDVTKPLLRGQPIERRSGTYSMPFIPEDQLISAIFGEFFDNESSNAAQQA